MLTDLPLPLGVSRLAAETEVLAEWRTLAMQAGGLLLDRPRWLAAALPTRFGTAKAAGAWLEDGWPTPCTFHHPAKEELIGRLVKSAGGQNASAAPEPVRVDPLVPVILAHRPKAAPSRQGAPQRGVWLGPLTDAPAAVEAAVGKPVDLVGVLGTWLMLTTTVTPAEAAAARAAVDHLAIHEGKKMMEATKQHLAALAAEAPFTFAVVELTPAEIIAATAAAKHLKNYEARQAQAEEYQKACRAHPNSLALANMLMDEDKMDALDLELKQNRPVPFNEPMVNDWIKSNP